MLTVDTIVHLALRPISDIQTDTAVLTSIPSLSLLSVAVVLLSA